MPALLTRRRDSRLPARTEKVERLLEQLAARSAPRLPFPVPAARQGVAPAVAAAAACPDLFLLATAPGLLRLTAAVEIVEQARQSDSRLLVLVDDPATADALVDRLTALCLGTVGRAIAPDERIAGLSPASAERTALAIGECEAAAERRLHENTVALLEHRLQTAQRLFQILARQARVQTERDRIAQTIQPDDPVFHDARIALDSRRMAAFLDIEARERAARTTREQADTLLTEAQKAAQSTTSGFFKKLFGGKVQPDAAALARISAAETELTRIDQQLAALTAERQSIESSSRLEIELLVLTEVSRRQREHDEILAGLSADAALLEQELGAVDDLEKLEAELTTSRAALADVIARPPAASRAALQSVDLVVAPLAAVGSDPFLVAAHPEAEAAFDLFLITHGEGLSEAEFLTAAKSAAAWVILGSPAPPGGLRPYRNGKPLPRGGFFEWAWVELDHRPFTREANQLVVSLVPVPADRRHTLSREPLADQPEIELRFFECESGEAVLSAVAFPLTTDIRDAKRFLARELGEARLATFGLPTWQETADEIVCIWPAIADSEPDAEEWLTLMDGARERVVGTGDSALTAAVAFATADGWDRDRAEAWIQAHQTEGLRTAVYTDNL